MPGLALDVHGVGVRLSGDAVALDELGAHFGALRGDVAPAVSITLERGAPSLDGLPRTRADQVLERGVVYNQGPVTWVDHYGHAVSRYDFAAEQGTVRAPETADLVEIAYLMVHSRLGVLLEARGL